MPLDIRNPARLPAEIRVFYSWQSDLDKKLTRNLIKKAIKTAISRLNQEFPEDVTCSLILDEGVNNRAGSPDIKEVIFEKIRGSHMVIGDLSMIAQTPAGDKLSNPNVFGELFYAAGKYGWSRVIGVLNDSFGKVEELAFDIRGHRISVYSCANEGEVTRAARSLEETMYLAIRAVVEEIDHGPITDETASTAAIKKSRDLRMLRDVLTTITSRIFEPIDQAATAGSFLYDSFYFWEGFRAVVDSVGFNLYDKPLQADVEKMRQFWGDLIDAGQTIFHPGRNGGLVLKDYQYFCQDDRDNLEKYQRSAAELLEAARGFYSRVHADYPEIDVDEMNTETLRILEPYLNPERP